MLPHYKREGKAQLVVAIGCTGGQHRSVALAEYIGQFFKKDYQYAGDRIGTLTKGRIK